MIKSLIVASLLLSSTFATPALAEEGKGSIGLGKYVLVISDGITTDALSGFALVGGYDITNNVSVVGRYYALTHIDFSNISGDGFDVALRLGPNSPGFIYFGQLGYYSETVTNSNTNFTADYSGFLYGGGIGYNFGNLNLAYGINIRSTGDYEGNSGISYTAVSGALSLSYIF